MTTDSRQHRLAVLFVDDEAKARKYFARAFAESHHVICAESVDEAIGLLDDHAGELALLVTDQRMPNRTGIDLIRYAKRNHPHIIRILTTAYADLADAIASVNDGEVYRYIRKPWDLNYLQEEIDKAGKLYLKAQEEKQILLEKREVMYRVASNIAHELRTPLTGIGVSVDAISSDIGDLLETHRLAQNAGLDVPHIDADRRGKLSRALAGVGAHVERAHNIIDMLLVSARSWEEDKLEVLSAADCIRQAVDTYPLAEHQKNVIRLNVEQDFRFLGMRILALHILYNLIKNSLHAIGSEAPQGEISIEVSVPDKQGLLKFRDNGTGISAEEMPFIFNEFFTTKLESSNNGVGLAFCKRTLQQWGASIRCHSAPGEFTEFALTFPVVQVDTVSTQPDINNDVAERAS